MLGIYEGNPAIYCPQSGKPVVVFPARSSRFFHGWSRAIREAVKLSREINQ